VSDQFTQSQYAKSHCSEYGLLITRDTLTITLHATLHKTTIILCAACHLCFMSFAVSSIYYVRLFAIKATRAHMTHCITFVCD